MEFKSLKFFVENAKQRLTHVRSGTKLIDVVENQIKENKMVI